MLASSKDGGMNFDLASPNIDNNKTKDNMFKTTYIKEPRMIFQINRTTFLEEPIKTSHSFRSDAVKGVSILLVNHTAFPPS